MKNLFRSAVVATTLLAFGHVQAHIVFAEPKASAGAYFKASLRVGHGCQGAATQGITVFIPEGFEGAKPQPKAGWSVTTRKSKRSQPYFSHGKTVSEDVVEISWKALSADSVLPDDFYDEFSWMARLPQAPQNVWVRVLQICTEGFNDWSEVPLSGASTKGLKTPAALLVIEAPETPHMHH